MSRPSIQGDAALHDGATPEHVDTHGDTYGHGSRKRYRIGIILSVLLTGVPFWLVMSSTLHDAATTAALIFAMAMVQIVVHVVCFLHLDARSEGGWALLAFLFTTVIVVLTIGGSIWVMYHLNINMMPGGEMGPVH